MASIIGHLEEDHLTLRRRLSAAPELVQPVMEAQTQLNRLKGLMHNMFSSRSFLDRTEETTEKLPEDTSSAGRCEGSQYESSRLGSGELVGKVGDESTRVSGLDTVRHESTRIQDDFRPPYTPRHRRFRREDAMENFSPIVLTEAARQVLKEHNSKEELEMAENEQSMERKARQRLSQPEYFTLVTLEDTEKDQTEETLVQSTDTFSCTTSDRPSVSSSLSESSDPSLSRLGLNDLSCRLGGTGLYISRDNGLDITERLDEEEEDEDEEQEDGIKEEKRDSKYEDTVEELERLMVKLSTVFDSFRNPNNEETEKLPDHGGSREGIFGLVSDINKDLCSMLANSKESHI